MPEAMKLIRAELGNDAVILNSKIVHTGGFFGLFRKKKIEVIAAVDQVPKGEPRILEKERIAPKPLARPSSSSLSVEDKKITEKSTNDILNELSELKKMIRQVSANSSGGTLQVQYPEPIQKVAKLLEKQEIDLHIREKLLTDLLEKWFLEGSKASDSEVLNWCKQMMIDRIKHYSYGEISYEKKFVNVVGPTGVGKTTTLAKIAADSILKYHKKVGFITTDTYRIAAIDQLKTYAKILSVPIEVCYNQQDFKKACEAFKDYDIVFIDTAGRNFRNKQYVEELKKVLPYDENMETFLVLSLTSKQQDMEEIFEQFKGIQIHKFIFTKLDETSYFGSMYNMVDKYKMGIAYITNGQNVPDDRIPATAEKVTNIILGVETK